MVLITGASGFVGRALSKSLAYHYPLRISVRDKSRAELIDNVEVFEASISPHQDWSSILFGVSTIIHCAARVHVMKGNAALDLPEFLRLNFHGTINLARQAAQSGVCRFIFLSSIKVNGEFTELGHPFMAGQITAPSDSYGVSKNEAEIGLMTLSKETRMEVVIIRAPLVYGPGVKANFLSMMNWLWRGFPMPFGAITKNYRSFIFIDNLVSIIITCINHPAAANQLFLVSDDEDLSTAELLERMALALGRSSKLIAVPPILIKLVLKLAGRTDIGQRLCGSLQVDISKTKNLLGWSPPVSVNEGMRQTAVHFLRLKTCKDFLL